ncbi:glycosyltransferase family 2 protein [Niabella insulamsoli]|uniref:glycosyltransferase family 2 protein n=1 Tax=Niabella insulamsoli TaxID=3144874 RepID=UPI0031FC9BE4
MPLTSIITVNYNQPAVTIEFLKSVRQFADPHEVEVILVDNAPAKNWRLDFIEAYPDLVYIHSSKNLGYAGGNNLGIKSANGTYILLLNNDTEITASFVSTLVREMEQHPEIGLLSPLIKFFEQKDIIQYAGFSEMNYFTARNAAIGSFEQDKGQYNDDSRETGFCHGAAVMCRKDDLERAGLMDERYFLYYEELDWCEKFKRIGKKIWFTGKAVIYHKESMSVGKASPIKSFFMSRNRMLYVRKNTNAYKTAFFTAYYTFVATPKQVLVHLKNGRTDLAVQTLKGLWWNFTHSSKSASLGYKLS